VLLRGALAGELTHHLGYANGAAPEEVESHRNGYSEETVVGEEGAMKIEVPRDRSGSFEPLLIAKEERSALKASMRRSSRCMRAG
jgi:putative transposase